MPSSDEDTHDGHADWVKYGDKRPPQMIENELQGAHNTAHRSSDRAEFEYFRETSFCEIVDVDGKNCTV